MDNVDVYVVKSFLNLRHFSTHPSDSEIASVLPPIHKHRR